MFNIRWARLSAYLSLSTFALLLAGCETMAGNIALGAVAATVGGSVIPAHEIEQIYYLGTIDPMDQVPPSIYRITVRGQSSFISRMRYGSGWVPANLIDTLNSRLQFEPDDGHIQFFVDDRLTTSGGIPKSNPFLKGLGTDLDRRMIQFGPERFRPVPKDHRLVIVMGSDPEAFFNAIDTTLGTVAQASVQAEEQKLDRLLLETDSVLRAETEMLQEMELDTLRSEKAAGGAL